MQDREPIIPDHIWSLPRKPAGLPDVLSRNRDDVLVLRGPYGDRARPVLLATMALAASFALGWAGALNWPEVANLLGVDQIAQKEAPSPPIAEARSGGKIEGVRKTASTSDLRTAAPATVGSIPRPSAASPGGARLPADPSSAAFASQANTSPAAVAMAMKLPWRLRRKRGRQPFPGGPLSRFGTEPPCSRAPTEFGWPRAATRFPASGELNRSCAGATAGSLPPPTD